MMCIIIDANAAHKFAPIHHDVEPVARWLLNHPAGCLISGGELKAELAKAGADVIRFLKNLKQAGRLTEIPETEIDSAIPEVKRDLSELTHFKFNDFHVIALARVSGARLLVSYDSNSGLHHAFTTSKYLKPAGRVYQNQSHKDLLNKVTPCRVRKAKRKPRNK